MSGVLPLRVCHAGALKGVLRDEIAPAFRAATGQDVQLIAGQSVRLANELRRGEIEADVFLSADDQVNALLMGADNGNVADWYVSVAGNEMVIAYNRRGRFGAELDAAARGEHSWYEVLQTPALRFGRNDPRRDPGGYRVIFLFQHAERHAGCPGLKDRILQGDDNEAQILRHGYQPLRDGEVDAVATYRTIAIDNHLPYIALPDEVNLREPALAQAYAACRYTNPRGQSVHGAPILFTATVLQRSQHQAAGAAFIQTLHAEDGRRVLERHGFEPVEMQVCGNAESTPTALAGHGLPAVSV